jgi:DNA-binding XRE family transcriptional regulator
MSDMTRGKGRTTTPSQGPGGRPTARDHAPPGDPAGHAAAAARQAAGRRLKDRRVQACLSQAELGGRIGYSRTAIGEAETKGAGAADLWERADTELAAGGELVRLHQAAQAAVAAEAAAASARPGRLSAVPTYAPGAAPADAGGDGLTLVTPGYCPHCGHPVLLQTQLADTDPG